MTLTVLGYYVRGGGVRDVRPCGCASAADLHMPQSVTRQRLLVDHRALGYGCVSIWSVRASAANRGCAMTSPERQQMRSLSPYRVDWQHIRQCSVLRCASAEPILPKPTTHQCWSLALHSPAVESQHPPAPGERSSPGAPVHPGEGSGGTEPIGGSKGALPSRLKFGGWRRSRKALQEFHLDRLSSLGYPVASRM